MSLISELEYERNRYYKLMDNIKILCTHLNNSSTHVENANAQLDKYYRIDNESADGLKLETTCESISTISHVLTTKIIPAISSRISQLDVEIVELNEPEEELLIETTSNTITPKALDNKDTNTSSNNSTKTNSSNTTSSNYNSNSSNTTSNKSSNSSSGTGNYSRAKNAINESNRVDYRL